MFIILFFKISQKKAMKEQLLQGLFKDLWYTGPTEIRKSSPMPIKYLTKSSIRLL